MLADSKAALLLSQSALLSRLSDPLSINVIDLDQLTLDQYPDSNPWCTTAPENLAYSIYTSGSTGWPKGVLIEHRNTGALIDWALSVYSREQLCGVLASTSICFDLSVWEIFVTLSAGGYLVLAKNALEVSQLAARERVGLINTVPSAIRALLDGGLLPASVHTINLAGEPLKQDLVDGLYHAGNVQQVFDLYGPSEDTTYSTFTLRTLEGLTNIGRPISHSAVYILDEAACPVPIRGTGELYISGAGLSRGYLGRPALTAEKFLPNAFDNTEPGGGRVYRTGDLARYRIDGVLEYAGRLDHQVKIRGFRIELSEIEARLQTHPAIREAVVLDWEGASGKQLVAYVVPDKTTSSVFGDERNVLGLLREHLKQALPDFMVPAHIMLLEHLPLTPNGKLDRKALPQPDLSHQSAYVVPRSTLEQQIALIWAQVLKLERVGVTDNFFELGGDSIISIQVVSRARERGVHFTPKELFHYQTVQGLASVARQGMDSKLQIDQGPVVGQSLLLPIQQFFFDEPIPHRHHWNQAVLLKPGSELEGSLLDDALRALRDHHDALGLSFFQEEDRWVAHFAKQQHGVPGTELLWQVQVRNSEELEVVCNQAQRSLSLEQGPLLRAVLASMADGSQRLLIVIHHLVVDGVSWRILLEDLQAAYLQLAAGTHVRFAEKTSSVQAWAERLRRHVSSEDFSAQEQYWLQQVQGASDLLPCDHFSGSLQQSHAAVAETRLDKVYTHQLLHTAPAAYRTQINDLLLTALVRVIARWTRDDDVLIQLEGHGREDLFDDIDLTRTVGWLTSMFPIKLTAAQTLSGSIKRIKEQLRAVPGKGIGFGVLRYLGEPETRDALSALPQPRITFNYLGQFDGSFAEPERGKRVENLAFWVPAAEHAGATVSQYAPLNNWLSIDAQVFGGELSLTWRFSQTMFRTTTIERLAQDYADELQQLIDHCVEGQGVGVTPSDFPLAGLNQEQLDCLPFAAQEIEDIYPLSPMQQGMLFHTLYQHQNGDYINQLRVNVQGLEVDRFRDAWQTVVDRHEVLRAGFITGVEQPLQIIRKKIEFPFTVLDWSGEPQLHPCLEAWALADRLQGFDLQQDPLLRLAVIRTGADSHHLVYTSHHILMDGWSNSQLLGEVLQAYSGTLGVFPSGRYRDYIQWLKSQDTGASETFWRGQLQALEEPTRLAQVFRSVVEKNDGHGDHYQVLDPSVRHALGEFSRQQRVTLNTVMQAAWLLLLQQYTGRDCVSFGATVAGRPADLKGVEQQLGLFINTLPIISSPRAEQTVSEWLGELQAKNLAVREYEHAPLFEIQQWAGCGGDVMFDSILVFENFPVSEALEQGSPAGVCFTDVQSHEQTNYPLTLAIGLGETLTVHYRYGRESFSDDVIKQIAQHFNNSVQGIIQDGSARIAELSMLDKHERQRVLLSWNRAPVSYPDGECIHQVIEAWAQQRPDATAVVCDEQTLSYGELNRRSNRLAHRLRNQGVGPDVLVGIAAERSLDMVVGLLAILKAGGAYLPLDPGYPQDRLAYIIEDSGIDLLLIQAHLPEQLSIPKHIVCIELDTAEACLAGEMDKNPVNLTVPKNLAYVIYTSGSTGKPKGTLLPHHNVMRLFKATAPWFKFDTEDVWTVFHSSAFDFSVWELFGAFLYGGKAVLVSKDTARSPEDFLRVLIRERVTVLNQTPSAFKQLIPLACSTDKVPRDLALRHIIFGGEALDVSSLEPWFVRFGDRQPQLTNMYGITETTVHVTYRPLLQADVQQAIVSPIGEVIPDLSWYLLDKHLSPAAPGSHGELYIGRAGLARGYHQRPALTAERFIPDPFDCSDTGGGRLYRSGDLAVSGAKGEVEYAGRIDHQVKIRGFRIERGEIEAKLKDHPVVDDVVVQDREGPDGKQLIAYVCAAGWVDSQQEQILRSDLREWLKTLLPDYMVPAHFIFLKQWPLTSNGKLDRKALPTPDANAQMQAYQAPRTELERQLSAIWAKVLKVERVGLSDSFFELGGHSLLATQTISQINTQLGIDVPLRLLFEKPVFEDFSEALKNDGLSLSDEGLSDIEKLMDEMKEF